MKSGSALFLSLFIFFMSFLAQSGLSFSDSSSTSISSEAPISYAQPIAGCGEGPVGHPCHFGHLGGCAPIQVGDGFFLYINLTSNNFNTKSFPYTSPYMDGIYRPPIFI